jgi:polysaccharide biosynthesis/export protein
MFKIAALPLLLSLSWGGCTVRAWAQAGDTSLLQYIRYARKAGLGDVQIAKNAEEAGWPVNVVESALASASPGQGARPQPTRVSAPQASLRPQLRGDPTTEKPETLPTKSATPSPLPPTQADDDSHKRGTAFDDYQIGAGDVLHISVSQEPEDSVESAVVRPDGKISMPLLNDVSVLGLTVVQAELLITTELSKFLTAPNVTVIVQAINSKKIYILGGVKKEGPIPYTYRMTVLQALTEAGGLTDWAKRKKIYVLHDENGRQFTFPFDYDAVLKGQHMESNIYLTPGDTVVVPR